MDLGRKAFNARDDLTVGTGNFYNSHLSLYTLHFFDLVRQFFFGFSYLSQLTVVHSVFSLVCESLSHLLCKTFYAFLLFKWLLIFAAAFHFQEMFFFSINETR